MKLLTPDDLVETSELDKAEWNYRPGPLGRIARRRYDLVIGALGSRRRHVLEVGYGSGVFMPELTARAAQVTGTDTHPRGGDVRRVLRRHGAAPSLVCASVTAMPFEDATFDAVVAVSTLEFVDDIERACSEMARVLEPGGTLVVVTPGHAPVLDVGLRVLTGERAEDTFQGRRAGVIPAIEQAFDVRRLERVPRVPYVWLYTLVVATPR